MTLPALPAMQLHGPFLSSHPGPNTLPSGPVYSVEGHCKQLVCMTFAVCLPPSSEHSQQTVGCKWPRDGPNQTGYPKVYTGLYVGVPQ